MHLVYVGCAYSEALDPAARAFIASAEEVFRRHRDDAAFNLHGVVTDFANAFEVQVNQLLLAGMRGAPEQTVNGTRPLSANR